MLHYCSLKTISTGSDSLSRMQKTMEDASVKGNSFENGN